MIFNYTDEGFNILKDDIVIINHSKENPALYVGFGKEKIDMYRGNFNIKDYLIERIPLRDFTVEKEKENSFKIIFEDILELKLNFKDEKLELNFNSFKKNINRFWIRIKSSEAEKIYGLGEQMSYFNLKGRNYPIWTSEPGVGRDKSTYITWRSDVENKAGGDYYTTNFPQPTFVSINNYYLHLDSTAYSNFNFTNDDFTEIEVWEVPKKIIIEFSENLLEVVKKLSDLLGRQEKLPDWVYNGLIIGAQGGTDKVKEILENSLAEGIKVSALWCQDWCGKKVTSFGKRLKWNWKWDEEQYPKLPEFIKDLEKNNIKFMGYANPYLLEGTDLYKEGFEKGYFATKEDGSEYLVDFGEFYCGVVDFTNPDAFDWFKNILKKNLIEFGLSGWMADFGEYLPTDVKLYNRKKALIEHNRWPVLWAKCNYEALKETKKLEEVLYFMRAGGAGSQKYCTLLWAGDQSVDFSIHDGLISVVKGAISSAMTAIGMTHSDIGGYTSLFGNIRTKELFLRWAEMATFSPVMRTHEGNRPEENFQYYNDKEAMRILGYLTRVYTHISPYIKDMVNIASDFGIPVQRPLVIHYQDDERCQNIDTQYLLGEDLLVAPVFIEKDTKRKLYLPKDKWVYLWDNIEYTGGDIEIDAPIGKPAVFYRKDSKYKDLFEKVKNIK